MRHEFWAATDQSSECVFVAFGKGASRRLRSSRPASVAATKSSEVGVRERVTREPTSTVPENAVVFTNRRLAPTATACRSSRSIKPLQGQLETSDETRELLASARGESQRTSAHTARGPELLMILDLIAADDRLNVYRGELEVRPPGAPTTAQDLRRSVSV